ncbi:DNA cytosine methyltransferase [Burkholderia sp. BE17]|uniref:DNA cytosine methyltransferase n=1 Tax=Burkholderia sp. BE17 TaxID=2656644 RepID=UPI00128C85EC|nr:DNA cytosine methyltransferase [Burkholderia sp. BE17]MPV69065.1 DNA (cytosine-5-)-methyltransferase [Burkholderia sp. BE17]
MSRPIGIDLFAGAGGLSLGFEQAGFDVVAAVEIDPIHAAVHEFNFPDCAVIPLSVEKLTGAQIRKAAGIGKKRVDVVFGGAPCQGFSMIGQRALDDPRNALVRHFVRLVHELDAQAFVFENVKGITVGKHAQFLNELIAEFSSIGYDIRLPWKILNAAHFGAPQFRERLILMGCKKGSELPAYPAPIFRPAGTEADLAKLPEGPSCYDALNDVPDAEDYEELLSSDAVKVKWGKPSAYAKTLRGTVRPPWDFSYSRQSNTSVLTSSMRSDHTDISRRRFEETQEGTVEPISRFFKLPRTGVSNTLRAGTDSARGAFTSPRPIHYKYARCITVREMARLHGFPDWFRLHQTKWHGARQIGNSVPPPLARAVAAQVIDALGVQPTVPNDPVKQGNVSLLQMDMGQASTYFGISTPIGKRDKKGAPKRKQWDDRATDTEQQQSVGDNQLDTLDAGTELV